MSLSFRLLLLCTLLTFTHAQNSTTSIQNSTNITSSTSLINNETNITTTEPPPTTEEEVIVSTLNAGDTAWILTSTALVLMMTPALGFFYGGLVNDKNILNQLFLSYICMGIVTVQWVLYGYSFAFDIGTSTWGTFNWGVLRFGEGTNSDYSATYPLLLHAMYQGAFAIITPAIISGSIVGRIRFMPYVIFILLWSTLCYDPLAHWVWSVKGWLRNLGVNDVDKVGTIDFAGGTVVHISSGVAGLVASYIVGKRVDYDHGHSAPAPNLPFTLLGSGLLWVGWNGFNAGSSGAANGVAALAMVNTNVGAAAAMLAWCFLEVAVTGNPTIAGASTGAVVGLVVITPACGFVQPGWAIFMCIIGAGICFGAIRLKKYLRADDTLDVFACHGVGGIAGALMTGLFAQKEWGGVDGAFYGRGVQLWYQIAAVLTTVGYSAGITAGILLLLKYTIGLRPDVEAEKEGLDVRMHGETFRKDTPPNHTEMVPTKSIEKSLQRQQTANAAYPIQSDVDAEILSGHSALNVQPSSHAVTINTEASTPATTASTETEHHLRFRVRGDSVDTEQSAA